MSETLVGSVIEVELAKIHPSRLNPRLEIDSEALNELTSSIQKTGLLQPLIVRQINGEYEVVVGERRFRAARKASLKKVPVIVRRFTDDEVIELSLIENVQREDLSAVEKGNACKRLMMEYPDKYPTIETVAQKVDVSSRTVSSWFQLVQAPRELQRLVAPSPKIGVPRQEGKIDYDTAVTITRQIKEPEKQVEVAREIAKRPVFRREAREVIARISKQPEKPVAEVIKEVVEAPYELPFRLDHMEPILKGVKTQTSRRGIPDAKVSVGALVHACIWQPRFADLRVVSIERKKLSEFTEEDAKREGGYTLNEFRSVWKDIYGEWDNNETVNVIRFEKTNPKK
jgi:ParB family chromosome partitioning protein